MSNEIKNLSYYKRCFIQLNRSARKGEKAPHKPILLLAMIDRVEQLVSMGVAGHRMINQLLIDLNPKLEQYFYKNWNQYVKSELFAPSFSISFWYISSGYIGSMRYESIVLFQSADSKTFTIGS